MNTTYVMNKKAAIFVNKEPTKTDQAGAAETDINIIVRKMGVGAVLPSSTETAQYADISEFPQDLREMLETSRTLNKHMQDLPPQFREMGVNKLLALTPENVEAILTAPEQPAEKPAAKPPEEKK